MLRFVMNQWRRQRFKFILTLVGALIISAGLSLMFNLTDSSQGTVEQTLQKKWSSAYDIVVRPKGSQILKFPKGNGIYRLTTREYDDSGIKKERLYDQTYHVAQGTKIVMPEKSSMSTRPLKEFSNLYLNHLTLLVAIEPVAEAKLVGLDKSILDQQNSRYFTDSDRYRVGGDDGRHYIPVLINPDAVSAGNFEFTVEKLEVPYSTEQDQQKIVNKLLKDDQKKSMFDSSLNTYPSKVLQKVTVPVKDMQHIYFNSLHGKTTRYMNRDASGTNEAGLFFKTSPLTYDSITSPFKARWSHAYEVKTEPTKLNNWSFSTSNIPKYGYRSIQSNGKKTKSNDPDILPYVVPYVSMDIIGQYESNKIKVSKDPLNELPMETYRPSTADLVLDADQQPINPARKIRSSGNPVGLLTNSPNILTTLDSARAIYGEKSISSIRLKVKGATTVSEESEQLLQDVKTQIEQETGLIATITKGSSPQPVVTKVVDNGKTLGWIEQPWVHIGAAMTIFRETSVGFSGVIFAMLAVAIVYVLATSYVSMLARRKEFAVLLALGWRTKDLYRIVLIEAVLLAGFVSVIALLVESIFSYVRNETMNGWSLLWITLFSLVIYFAGAAWSAFTIRKISPYEAIKTGEYASSSHVKLGLRSTWTLALKEIFGKWKRNALSILSIALPTALLTFFLFVTFHLQGVLYTSWLGQFVALQVGPMHYVTMGVAITIAILTTGKIMWQNVTDRRASLAILKAVGWTNRSVRQLIVLEGMLIGFVAGIVGLSISYITIYVLYDLVPWDEPLLIAVSLLLPVLFGTIASLLPAQIAARVNPYQELKDAG
ncbi:ABC transporter permease [Exiguobacterium antarcticum]|uniref:ABC transporter permease n=1 Tax=Exiguobacterium antarcticum TaxID=132920 RepID=UPI0004791091|nr:ABC transporter permease [Exiguobacterium antarcticum]